MSCEEVLPSGDLRGIVRPASKPRQLTCLPAAANWRAIIADFVIKSIGDHLYEYLLWWLVRNQKYVTNPGSERGSFLNPEDIMPKGQYVKKRKKSVAKGLFTYYVSQNQGFLDPPSPLCQQWSAFGLPPLPPSSAFVSIYPTPLFYCNFLRWLVYMLKWIIFIY